MAALIYGGICYLIFLFSFLYAIGFVENLLVPKTIDGGPAGPVVTAVIVNLVLLGLFAIQHSAMARQGFKRWWTQFVPRPIERSTYVLASSLVLLLLLWQWRPIPAVVWSVGNSGAAGVLLAISFLGWGIVLTSTFLINHFDLFGLQQIYTASQGKPYTHPGFRTPLFYKVVRQFRIPARLLVDAGDDRGAFPVRGRHDWLHPDRHPARRAGSRDVPRLCLCRISQARVDDHPDAAGQGLT